MQRRHYTALTLNVDNSSLVKALSIKILNTMKSIYFNFHNKITRNTVEKDIMAKSKNYATHKLQLNWTHLGRTRSLILVLCNAVVDL